MILTQPSMKPQLKVRQRFDDDNQRLILGSAAVADQSFDACAGVLIPGEMDEISSDDPGFAAIALMVASGLRGAPNYV
jgi:hypothetical protein